MQFVGNLVKAKGRMPGGKRLVVLKDQIRRHCELVRRHFRLDHAMQQALHNTSGVIPGSLIADLYAQWGDPLSQGSEHYLKSCLAEAASCDSDVIQSGASLLTLLLGVTCRGAGNERRHIWCLEHDGHWANLIRSWLTEYKVANVHVIVSRPKLYEGYSWYSVDTKRLPGNIRLALCDGTRGTPRGVVGLVERLGDNLAADCTILSRNVSRRDDLEYLKRWAAGRNASCVVVDKSEGFVKVTPQ